MKQYKLGGSMIVEFEPEYLIQDSDINPLVRSMIRQKQGKTPSYSEIHRVQPSTASQMLLRRMVLSDAVWAFERNDLSIPIDTEAWINHHFVLHELGFGVPEMTLGQKIKNWFINIFE